MRTLVTFLLLASVIHAVHAAPATGTAAVTFTSEARTGWEFVVEEKGTAAGVVTWTEKAKSATVSEIRYQTLVETGTLYVVRMYAREIARPTNKLGPSAEASVMIPLAGPPTPGNVQVRILLTVQVVP